jgi:hypothetical protein
MEKRSAMKWTFEETVLLADHLVSHDGKLPEGAELTALRDRLYPYRSEGSVSMHALDLKAALGYGGEGRYFAETKYSTQIGAVATLFKTGPADMAGVAHDLDLVRQIRQRHLVLADATS